MSVLFSVIGHKKAFLVPDLCRATEKVTVTDAIRTTLVSVISDNLALV